MGNPKPYGGSGDMTGTNHRIVFLSSTARDLHAHREAVYKAIEGLDDWHCVRMEDFGARDDQSDEFCRAKVAACDLFVGIVGHLFGGNPPDGDRSFTQREYDAAVQHKKPRLMFLAPEDFPVPADLHESDDKRARQRKFRDQVNADQIRDTFTSVDDLARRVVAAIRNWERGMGTGAPEGEGPHAGALIPRPPQPYFVHPYPMQSHFTGRAAERRTLTQWFTQGTQPVFAYVAIGGMGKSALTWAWVQRDVLGLPLSGVRHDPPEMAQTCRVPDDRCPVGVFWWSFYERDAGFAAFVSAAIAYFSGGEIDPRELNSNHDQLQSLLTLLQSKHLLLVLDGFERELRAYAGMNAAYQGESIVGDQRGDHRCCIHPLAGEFLRKIASQSLVSRVLVTSRLCPRELDDLAGCQTLGLHGMAPDDVVGFFSVQGIRGTRAEINGLCEPYDYHPLSVRLLAGLVLKNKRNPGDITSARNHGILADLKGKEQHHILQVAYDDLEKSKRTLLSQFAAFRNPMNYESLIVLNPYPSDAAFDAALDELMDRGLLLFDRQQNRYDLHPIVRRYAYDRLGAPDRAAAHTRLRNYFAAVPPPDKVTRLEDLAPVIELYHHTVRAGQYDEACDLFHDRLDDATYYQLGAYHLRTELLRALFPDGEDRLPCLEDESNQAWTLNELANSYGASGQPRRAVPLFEQHNSIYEKLGNKSNLATGLGNVANGQSKIGALRAAEANLRRRIALTREIKGEFSEAIGHVELGRLLAYRGAHAESEAELASSEIVFDKRGPSGTNFVSVVRAYRALRELLMFRSALTTGDASSAPPGPQFGNWQLAIPLARRALELADETARTIHPVEFDYVRAHWLLGAAHRVAGQTDEAERHLHAALERCRRINMVDHEADILIDLARLRAATHSPGSGQAGLAEEARRLAEEALLITERSGYVLQGADAHLELAKLARARGDEAAAREHAQKAKDLATCDGPPDYTYKAAYDEAAALLA
jgi:tetratricopeptide (TPR) repeat protein